MGIPAIKVWNIATHTASFFGKSCDAGRGEDEFLEWDQAGPNFEASQGLDGEVCISEFVVSHGTLKLTLMQSSSYNDFLSAVLTGDIAVPGGAGIGPFSCKDGQGTTKIAGMARISKAPPQKRGKKVGPCVWEFIIVPATRVDGGN